MWQIFHKDLKNIKLFRVGDINKERIRILVTLVCYIRMIKIVEWVCLAVFKKTKDFFSGVIATACPQNGISEYQS